MGNLFGKFKTAVATFAKNEEGVTAIEYALIASLIALAIIAAVTTLGGDLKTIFNNIGSSI
jgi:pilus assembly protein Flp/PilA